MNRASVVVSFYNNLPALKLILTALNLQSIKDFEVVIADDGSKPEVVKDISKLLSRYSFSIKHVWHEDKGFRKNEVLNKAILASDTEYIIFMDGDCIPHISFVADHLKFAKLKRVVAGRRVMMSEKLSAKVNEDFVRKKKLFSFKFFVELLIDSFIKKSRHVESAFFIRLPFINKMFGNYKRGVKGCNFSLHKSGLLAVNGFDMRYKLPCVGEDTDIEYRLKLLNYEVFLPKFRLIQYHLYHMLQSRDGVETNKVILLETIKHKRIKATLGINQLS
ncbi:MAG: glycosyltransferase [Bacteroidales bacterium]|nr:glycosyltransferase [Bacteroidales bacterium]